jgi:hypothetical protein
MVLKLGSVHTNLNSKTPDVKHMLKDDWKLSQSNKR